MNHQTSHVFPMFPSMVFLCFPGGAVLLLAAGEHWHPVWPGAGSEFHGGPGPTTQPLDRSAAEPTAGRSGLWAFWSEGSLAKRLVIFSGWWFQTFFYLFSIIYFFLNVNPDWLVVWNMNFMFHFMGCYPKPIDELHHFSRWLKPPTSWNPRGLGSLVREYYIYIHIPSGNLT